MNDQDTDFIRRAYLMFKAGAGLRSDDVKRLLTSSGYTISNSHLHELGRNSDRGKSITAEELYLLISAWTTDQKSS